MYASNSVKNIIKHLLLFFCFYGVKNSEAKSKYNVTCIDNRMLVELEKPDYDSEVYLDNLKYYPEIGCHPTYDGQNKALFNISLTNFSLCGITRITNQITGTQSFYHRIIIEGTNDLENRIYVNVKCTLSNKSRHNITRRNVLPAGFSEQEDIEITTTIENNAPEPVLKVAVKQGTSLVNGELNVKPGTPLTMEIYLDKESAPIYGLLVSFMRVSDTKSQDETIIFNGCSVDPYLFENFNTIDGDYLSAKFRAFKFPETTYVQFTGTVNICLDKCKGVECSNGQIGYGRRKREISGIPYDPKKVFEVTLTTYLKVDYKEETLNKENPERIFKEKRFSPNYKVLNLNDSHIVPLEDLYEENVSKKQDYPND
ncbi:hypothetical protein PGB90_009433 [Kerria lacca]